MTDSQQCIVVIDDDKNIRFLVSSALEEYGYKVQPFEFGLDAIQYIEQNPGAVDLVLTDILMPEITGIKIRKQLSGMVPELPVIGMTALIDDGKLIEKYYAIFEAILIKPFQFSELTDTVSKILTTKHDSAM